MQKRAKIFLFAFLLLAAGLAAFFWWQWGQSGTAIPVPGPESIGTVQTIIRQDGVDHGTDFLELTPAQTQELARCLQGGAMKRHSYRKIENINNISDDYCWIGVKVDADPSFWVYVSNVPHQSVVQFGNTYHDILDAPELLSRLSYILELPSF